MSGDRSFHVENEYSQPILVDSSSRNFIVDDDSDPYDVLPDLVEHEYEIPDTSTIRSKEFIHTTATLDKASSLCISRNSATLEEAISANDSPSVSVCPRGSSRSSSNASGSSRNQSGSKSPSRPTSTPVFEVGKLEHTENVVASKEPQRHSAVSRLESPTSPIMSHDGLHHHRPPLKKIVQFNPRQPFAEFLVRYKPKLSTIHIDEDLLNRAIPPPPEFRDPDQKKEEVMQNLRQERKDSVLQNIASSIRGVTRYSDTPPFSISEEDTCLSSSCPPALPPKPSNMKLGKEIRLSHRDPNTAQFSFGPTEDEVLIDDEIFDEISTSLTCSIEKAVQKGTPLIKSVSITRDLERWVGLKNTGSFQKLKRSHGRSQSTADNIEESHPQRYLLSESEDELDDRRISSMIPVVSKQRFDNVPQSVKLQDAEWASPTCNNPNTDTSITSTVLRKYTNPYSHSQDSDEYANVSPELPPRTNLLDKKRSSGKKFGFFTRRRSKENVKTSLQNSPASSVVGEGSSSSSISSQETPKKGRSRLATLFKRSVSMASLVADQTQGRQTPSPISPHYSPQPKTPSSPIVTIADSMEFFKVTGDEPILGQYKVAVPCYGSSTLLKLKENETIAIIRLEGDGGRLLGRNKDGRYGYVYASCLFGCNIPLILGNR